MCSSGGGAGGGTTHHRGCEVVVASVLCRQVRQSQRLSRVVVLQAGRQHFQLCVCCAYSACCGCGRWSTAVSVADVAPRL